MKLPTGIEIIRTWQEGGEVRFEARLVPPTLYDFPDGLWCSACQWVPAGQGHRNDCLWQGAYLCGWCGAKVTLHDTPEHECAGPDMPLLARGRPIKVRITERRQGMPAVFDGEGDGCGR